MTSDDNDVDDFDRLRGVRSRRTTHPAPAPLTEEPDNLGEHHDADDVGEPDDDDDDLGDHRDDDLGEPDDADDFGDGHVAPTDGTHGRRRRRRTFLALGIVLVPIVLVLGVGAWFLYELNPPGGAGKRVGIDIPRHTGVAKIGDLLSDKGVIGSSQAFQIYVGVTRAGPFEPGHYTMRENLGVRDAVNTLKSGPAKNADFRLVLPPGLTVSEIADRVGALKGHTRDAFLQLAQSGAVRSKYQPADVTTLEGLLYPDTYFVTKNETDQQILTRLVSTFDRKADEIGLSGSNAAGMSPYQTIVAASLIEREAKLDEDRPLISAVIHNRLASGRPLQIDATVCFAKGGCTQSPTSADLAIDSPYNTYKVAGLPPTPISNVTVKSLVAAQRPAPEPYLYYVLIDKNGKHAFATTQEEHERNVEEARKKGLL
ncbi:MAG TPA: endolytic transglycosylase MltG [Acidimicrobiia bacterium]|nr:endolytic transglycosylase MltG [Acidimicrobiia bacterium]